MVVVVSKSSRYPNRTTIEDRAMRRTVDHHRVVIVGAGVVGLCTALNCARRGMSVTIVERNAAQRDGCSFGNAGMVVPSHFIPLAAPGMVKQGLKWMFNPESPFYIRPRFDWDLLKWGFRFTRAATESRARAAATVLRDLGLLSLREYESLGIETGLHRDGLLMLCRHQQTLDEEAEVAEAAHALGIPAEVLDADATKRRDPTITMDVSGSVYFPLDGHLSPSRLMTTLATELARLKATFRYDSAVTGFAIEGNRLRAVQTSTGDVPGDQFVICSGIWSSPMAYQLGLKLPMQAGKGYSLTLSEPRQLPTLCSICTEARLAVTPIGGQLRFAGTMELSGTDESISASRVRGIVKSVGDYFPEFRPDDFDGVRPWSGLRPVSPDGLPYIGRPNRWDNLFVATGHAMMGVSLAPATAKIVADLLAGQPSPIPSPLLSPDRYRW